ncbi:MAG: class I SAM-dependent methyltransferase [Thermoplasmataceae archaeon]
MKVTVDFGVYHHSSREESEKMRKEISSMFSKAIENIRGKLPDGMPIRALDAGCGLGFISYLIYSEFRDAHIYAIDIFTDSSLHDNSMERTLQNFRHLGMSENVTVVRSDLRKIPYDDCYFGIAASSLVYHNLGNDFQSGISEIHRVLENDGIFLYGDIFVEKRMNQIEELFRISDSVESDVMKGYSLLTLIRK